VSFYLYRLDAYKSNDYTYSNKRDGYKGFCKYNSPVDCTGDDKYKPICKTKIDCSSAEWKDKDECRDCNGKDKGTKLCLECGGKDITNQKCYDCKNADKANAVCKGCPMKGVVNVEKARIRPHSCKRSMETCGGGSGISEASIADTAKCHEFAKGKKQELLQAGRDFDFKMRACGDLQNCQQANQDVDKNACMLRDVDVSNAYCITCPAESINVIRKMDAYMASGDQKPPSDQETSSCSSGIDNSVRSKPSYWNPTLIAVRKAKCARDGNPVDLKIEHLVDTKKLKLNGPPWDKPECYDCIGAHKNLLVCLDCDGKDRNNPKCYKCDTKPDMDKKFCVCLKNPNNKICFDCDGADKHKPACCDIDGKDKNKDACYDCEIIHKKTKHCECKKYPN
jgi:hypothetical protein